MAADRGRAPAVAALERYSHDDFETASIRSAAPSYISEAPSYDSTVPSENVPPYSPQSTADGGRCGRSSSTLLPSEEMGAAPRSSGRTGLPPVPGVPRRPSEQVPSLGHFRIPSWSTISANPTARHYHNVAHRRVSASSAAASVEGLRRIMTLGLMAEEEEGQPGSGGSKGGGGERIRPLEDPYLVGEEAARRAREERLARENGDEILIREDRRWDWFLAQMKDWDERDKSWKQFRREMEEPSRGRLARRIGAR